MSEKLLKITGCRSNCPYENDWLCSLNDCSCPGEGIPDWCQLLSDAGLSALRERVKIVEQDNRKLEQERDELKKQVDFDCSTHQCDRLYELARPYLAAMLKANEERDEVRRERDELVEEIDGGEFYCPECKSADVREIAYEDDFGSMECKCCGYTGGPGEEFPATIGLRKQAEASEKARRAGAEWFKDKVLATMNLADMTHCEYDETWIYALDAIRALPLEEPK